MKNIKWHFIFWLLYFVAAYIIDVSTYPETPILKELILLLTQNVFLFYSLLFFLNKFSLKTRVLIVISIGRLILIICSFITLRYFVRYHFLTKFINEEYGDMPLKQWFPGCFSWIINSFIYAAGYYYFRTTIQKQKDLLLSQEEKLTKEKENIQLENTALRLQINPHFLYNTLDFLYAKSLPLSAELSDGIMNLSDIMRYSLKPQDAEGLVYLTDEAEHILNIIDMNQLRFDNALNVIFTVKGHLDNIKIIPLLLITLVENMFKHGITNTPANAATITLIVDEEHQLYFGTHNKKRMGPKDYSTGIGLDNTLKRLSNYYGEHCSVVVNDGTEYFDVDVQIQLHKNKNNYFI